MSSRSQDATRRRLAAVTLGLMLWMGASSVSEAWGPAAHRLVNGWAVDSAPPEIRGFFEANRQAFIDHANDPDEWMKKDRYERNRHYIYLDKYGLFPYLDLPRAYRAAVERYGKGRIGRDGTLPWQVGEYSLRLTNALKDQDWEEARLDAAFLGHYVADAHDPLHTTQNFDGQLTGEVRLEERFAGRLVEKYSNFLMFHPDEAVKINDPTEYAFGMVLEANTWVDRIILADRQARQDLPGYNEDYLDRFYRQVGSTAMQELNAAAHDTASYWYTAWLNAGRPTLPNR
ncbi:MAG TPA: hypothetical protein VG204_02395 [Terriglobia bacterium]|nr:hypothetical protein [Terriglobia bacterium]